MPLTVSRSLTVAWTVTCIDKFFLFFSHNFCREKKKDKEKKGKTKKEREEKMKGRRRKGGGRRKEHKILSGSFYQGQDDAL